jgi:hypothetical protein
MAVLSSAERARIVARISTIDAQIAAAETALDDAITTGGVKEFRLDTGEGSQRMVYRDPADLDKLIYRLQVRRTHLQQRLDGTGLLNVNMRRKAGNYGY